MSCFCVLINFLLIYGGITSLKLLLYSMNLRQIKIYLSTYIISPPPLHDLSQLYLQLLLPIRLYYTASILPRLAIQYTKCTIGSSIAFIDDKHTASTITDNITTDTSAQLHRKVQIN